MPVPAASLDQFGAFASAASILYDSYSECEAQNVPRPSPLRPVQTPTAGRIPHPSVWITAAAHPELRTWGDVRQQPWATALDTDLLAFVSRTAPAISHTLVSAGTYSARLREVINRLPVYPCAPALPFLRMVADHNVLRTVHQNTISACMHKHMTSGAEYDDPAILMAFPHIGLTPAGGLAEERFGYMTRIDGRRDPATWVSPTAAEQYARYYGVDVATGTGGASAAAYGSSSSTLGCRMPTPNEWTRRVSDTCAALHRLAVALCVSDQGVSAGDEEVSLSVVATAAQTALAQMRGAVAGATATADADMRHTLTAGVVPRRLASAWKVADLNARVGMIRARLVTPLDQVDPIDDAKRERDSALEAFADIMPLMTAVRGAAMHFEAVRHLDRILNLVFETQTRMRVGSLAIRAQLDELVAEMRNSYEIAGERSNLIPKDGLDDVGEVTHKQITRASRLAGRLTDLAACHPAALTDDMCARIEAARAPTQFEREMFERMWSAFGRIVDTIQTRIGDLIFSHADVTLLGSATPLPQAFRAAYDSLVREYVRRCRSARESARALPLMEGDVVDLASRVDDASKPPSLSLMPPAEESMAAASSIARERV